MTTGDAIRSARQRAGLTQAALAQALGVQPLAVLRWEGGQRHPSAEVLRRIQELCGVEIEARCPACGQEILS